MKPQAPTRVPDVLDALVALFGSISDDVTVTDGPADRQPQNDCIEVGVSDEGGESVVVVLDKAPGLRSAYVEQLWVVCSLWSWSGDDAVRPRRERCRELLTSVDEKLRQSDLLGGLVDAVGLGSDVSWQQVVDDDGASVSVGFTVHARTSI